MQDPYSVLGVSPSASEDEIKKAYRALAKKYHPDVNQGSAEAERHMKEVNEAYSAVMKMRREGTSYGGSYGSSQGGYTGGFGGGYGGSARADDPYEGNTHMQAARNYILSGHYQEAMRLLEDMQERGAEWYFLFAQANLGVGNRIAALNYARQAVNMNPYSFEYRALLNRIEGNARYYQTSGQSEGFAMPTAICSNPILSCCAFNMLCNCCCGGRFLFC